jgi:undecaprenyl diphosphate synthase
LRLGLSYGSRTELGDAARSLARDVQDGMITPEEIDAETLRSYLYDPDTPDPDLMIRTAGEMRLSNFLLWQISYAELYVTDVCWPEFRKEHLLTALRAYALRNRSYGGLIQGAPADLEGVPCEAERGS